MRTVPRTLRLSGVITAAALTLMGCPKDKAPEATPPPKTHASAPIEAKPAAAPVQAAAPGKFMKEAEEGKPLYATLETSLGTIVCELDSKEAPFAVESFVGLAAGEKPFRTPQGETLTKPFYDGLIFHRVIPNFMVQTGDPTGTGMGGPGFTIKDDYPNQKGLHFTKGTLGMARPQARDAGGSQFFIMVADKSYLDGQYTAFGKVLSGQNVADAISKVPRDGADKPHTPVTLTKVTISDVAPAAGK